VIKQFVRAACVVAVTAMMAAFNSGAQAQQVGQATAIKNAAYQQPPSQAQAELKLQDSIIWKSTLSTPGNGALEVRFLDESRLSMGANSNMVIDEFTYAGPGGAGQQTLRLTKGLFRFVSGQTPKDKVRVETPAVSIGIRGTIFRTQVNDDGSGEVSVDYGPNGEVFEVILTSKSGKTIILRSGQKVKFDGDGVFDGLTDGTIEGCGP
jgi:ferric-dicitrate binding protein FerR (iron transport regulator)